MVKTMKNWREWIGKDVIVVLKDGKQKTGVLRGPVIDNGEETPSDLRLLNGIFVTRIKTKDITEIYLDENF